MLLVNAKAGSSEEITNDYNELEILNFNNQNLSQVREQQCSL